MFTKAKSILRPFIQSPMLSLSDQFYYGHRESLLASIDLPENSFLLGRLQHGWSTVEFFSELQPVYNRKGNRYPDFVWSNRLQKELLNKTPSHKEIYSIGSPWAHFIRGNNFQDIYLREYQNPQTIIYFPSHSFQGWGTSNIENKLDIVSRYQKNMRIVVCLYWLDFVTPSVRNFYISRGFEVTCLGFRGFSGYEFPWLNSGERIFFLPNLLKLLAIAGLVFADEVSSPFFYAASLGIPVALTSLESRFLNLTNINSVQDYVNSEDILRRIGFEGEISPGTPFDPMIKNIARTELGWDAIHQDFFFNSVTQGAFVESDRRLESNNYFSEFRKFVANFKGEIGGNEVFR
jgi:hypothetical protein